MTVLLNFSAVGASHSPTAHLQLNHYTTSHSSNRFKAEGIFIVPKGQHVVQPQTIGILKAQNSIISLLVLNFIINTVSLAFLRQHELSTLEYVGSARTDFFFFFFLRSIEKNHFTGLHSQEAPLLVISQFLWSGE